MPEVKESEDPELFLFEDIIFKWSIGNLSFPNTIIKNKIQILVITDNPAIKIVKIRAYTCTSDEELEAFCFADPSLQEEKKVLNDHHKLQTWSLNLYTPVLHPQKMAQDTTFGFVEGWLNSFLVWNRLSSKLEKLKRWPLHTFYTHLVSIWGVLHMSIFEVNLWWSSEYYRYIALYSR